MLRAALLVSIILIVPDAPGQPMARRVDTGAAIAFPEEGKLGHVVSFRAGSGLEKAGMKAGDRIVAIDGAPAADPNEFGAGLRRLRAGRDARFTIQRGNEAIEVVARLPGLAEESVEGVEMRYGEARSDKGYRVRTYTSRPRGATGRLPLVVFIPWLSCGAAENPRNADDGWSKMLRVVMRDAGIQMVRIEKPGVGDSEGPDCSRADLDEDMAAFRAGIRAALTDPGADPDKLYLFGGSVGGAQVPILAREFKVRGIIATGGFTRTWLEHMLDIERRRLTLSGKTPAEVNSAMRTFGGFYDAVLNRGQTPAQAIAAHPAWKTHWYDDPAHQYGRPIRYYQQLQALDVEDAWRQITVPTLIVWGEYDWIMGRDESDRAAAILRARDPKLVTYVVRPGMNHHFDVFKDELTAFKEGGGRFDEGAARVMVDWLRSR